MASANSEALTLSIIRSKLLRLLNRRAKAYEFSVKKGYTIPEYAEKIGAIKVLRAQLDGSATWSLQSNLRWIHSMKDKLIKILPSEFHDDQKQKRYRKHMLDLVSFCEDLLNTKPLFQNLNPIAMPKKIVRVKATALAERFGCAEEYFNSDIKGRDLTVLWETVDFVGVKDANGEEWNVPKSQLVTTPAETVGQEQTFGRGVAS